jgi:uncharacterized membrane protein YedE/YeeE
MRLIALCFGTAFGFLLGWARLTDYDVIQAMLRLREFDLYLLMGSAVATAAVGARLLRAAGARAWLDGSPVAWTVTRPTRSHLLGSLVFGVGWGIAGTCPGPVAAQLGRGQWSAAFTVAGIFAGVALFGYLKRRKDTPAAPTGTPHAAPGL